MSKWSDFQDAFSGRSEQRKKNRSKEAAEASKKRNEKAAKDVKSKKEGKKSYFYNLTS
jgi:hypothetical protein